MKQRLTALIQLLVAAALLGFIFRRLQTQGEIQALKDAFASAAQHAGWLALGIAGVGACIAICTIRWQYILRALGFVLPWREVFTLNLVGQFFNAFMFGATGGDLVKAYYVARRTANRKTEIVTSIFVERLIGLLTIIAMAPVLMSLRVATFWALPQTRAVFVMGLLLLAGAAIGLVVVAARERAWRWLPSPLRARDGRLAKTVQRVYEAMNTVWLHPGLLWRTVLLSALNHLTAVGATVLLGAALGLPLQLADYLAGMVAINLIASIPITPSGIGTRETASILILGALGASQGQAVSLSLMLYASILIWSLVGGGAYLLYVLKGAGRPRVSG